MKYKMFVNIVWMLGALALLIAPAGQALAKDTMVIATASTSGTFYVMGGGLAMVLQKDVPELKEVTAQVTAGSVENCRLLAKGQVDLAFVNAVVGTEAYHGGRRFKTPLKNLRTIFWGHITHQHFIVKKDSGIKSLADLKGKRVSIGAPGSGMAFSAMTLFKMAGYGKGDINLQFLPSGAGINALKDGKIDCALVAGGAPVGSITALAVSGDIDIINLDKALLEKLNQKYPGFVLAPIKKGTYKGVDHEIMTFAAACAIMVNDKMPEELASKIVKAVQAKQGWLAENVHKGFGLYSFDSSISSVAPLTPGAAKLYK